MASDSGIRVGSSVHGTPCCSWDADKRWKMLKTQEILESTRVPDPAAHYYGETNMDSASFYPTAIIEMNDKGKDMVNGSNRARKMYQAYKGQLKLSIGVNYGSLTVHVIQARHLTCKSKSTCDTFVKVSMVPNPSERTTCMTTLVPDTNHPVYDEKITYELLGCDYQRRIRISVYHHDNTTNSNEMIGCMSFGIRNIAKKKTVDSGWYYLLAEKLGSTKHMLVKEDPSTASCPEALGSQPPPRSLKRSRQNSHGSTASSGSTDTGDICDLSAITPVNHHDDGSKPKSRPKPPVMQVLTIPVINRKSKGGYGFTLIDGHPAKVSKIEYGSPADMCGLKEGDQVIKVNGQSVHKMYAEIVGRVIKHYPRCVVLDVLRSSPSSSSKQASQSVAVGTSCHFINHIGKDSDYSSDEDEYDDDVKSVAYSDNKENQFRAYLRQHQRPVIKERRDIVPLVALDANHNTIKKTFV